MSQGFVQVAFAGHNRASDLGDTEVVASAVSDAFALLTAAGVARARLLTGMAPGADVLAARQWRATGLGPVHAVFPFLADAAPEGAEGLIESGTWLDGEATRALGRNPHLAQAHWMIGAADLLVVVWTGEHARGAGGTADAVRLALEQSLPVLWIRPGETGPAQIIQPAYLDEDFGFLEFLDELRLDRGPLVQDATAATLRLALLDLGLIGEGGEDSPPADPPSAPDAAPRIMPLWRTYALFRRLLGGKATPFEARTPPPDLLAQPGFEALTRARRDAGRRAQELGAVHRSHQVILLGVAILAAVAGSASAVWPHLKLTMVTVELVLALGALGVWLDSERGERHHRWGEARKLAEDLRLERVAWTLGVSTMPPGPANRGHSLARNIRRAVGLPHGAYDSARVAAWGGWAVDELLAGQAAYHHDQARINGRISHRVHQVENTSFGLLLLVLVAYVAASAASAFMGQKVPHWMGGVVIMAGAIVPAIGAACLALEATLSLGDQARRSQALFQRLQALAADLGPAPSLQKLQSAVKAAIRLERLQEERWSEEASRRRLFRGG
jgi:hypothetical protein